MYYRVIFRIGFFVKEGGYDLRGMSNFMTPSFRTTRKSFCLSVSGNNLNNELKQCANILHFKRMCKEITLQRYNETEC